MSVRVVKIGFARPGSPRLPKRCRRPGSWMESDAVSDGRLTIAQQFTAGKGYRRAAASPVGTADVPRGTDLYPSTSVLGCFHSFLRNCPMTASSGLDGQLESSDYGRKAPRTKRAPGAPSPGWRAAARQRGYC